jgi:hypothetical protein
VSLSVEQCLSAITTHTHGLAEAAEGNLDRRIEHCPDWSMADLVWHLTGVHRFWNHIATERPAQAPEDLPELVQPADDVLIPGLVTGMETMVSTLGSADQTAPCWTWGQEETVWFITRHQVQEAAVHHWDAANAAGRADSWSMDPIAAMDAVEEFLTHSVANPRWPMKDAEPLGGTIWFRPSFAGAAESPTWHVRDGDLAGTLGLGVYDTGAPDIDGPVTGDQVDPSDLLLWLYRRLPEDAIDSMPKDDEARAMIARFRALTFTD